MSSKLNLIMRGAGMFLLMLSSDCFAGIPVIDAAAVASINAANVAITGAVESTMGAVQTVNSSINSMNNNLKNAIKTNGDNTVKAISGLNDALLNQNQDIMKLTVQENLNTQKKVLQAQGVQNAQAPPDTCATRASGNYSDSMTNGGKMAAIDLERRSVARSRGAKSGGKQADEVGSIHANKYCSKEDVANNSPFCKGRNLAPEEMRNADTKASSLFTGAGAEIISQKVQRDPRGPQAEMLTYTPEQMQAGQDYIDNVINATDSPRRLSAAEADPDSPQAKNYEALRLVYDARAQLPRSALDRILARRAAVRGSSAMLDEMFRSSGRVGPNLQAKMRQVWKGSGQGGFKDISQIELLKFEVDRRSGNPEWLAAIGQSNDSALLREMVYMQALSLSMQFEDLRDRELHTAIAAQQAADMLKSQLRPRLQEAEMAAMSTAGTVGR